MKNSSNGEKSERHRAALCLLYGLFRVGCSALEDAFVDESSASSERETVAALWRNHVSKDRRRTIYGNAVAIAKVSD
jgi:hypothetical protein